MSKLNTEHSTPSTDIHGALGAAALPKGVATELTEDEMRETVQAIFRDAAETHLEAAAAQLGHWAGEVAVAVERMRAAGIADEEIKAVAGQGIWNFVERYDRTQVGTA